MCLLFWMVVMYLSSLIFSSAMSDMLWIPLNFYFISNTVFLSRCLIWVLKIYLLFLFWYKWNTVIIPVLMFLSAKTNIWVSSWLTLNDAFEIMILKSSCGFTELVVFDWILDIVILYCWVLDVTIFLPKYSWALLWYSVKLFENSLVFLYFAFKLCNTKSLV